MKYSELEIIDPSREQKLLAMLDRLNRPVDADEYQIGFTLRHWLPKYEAKNDNVTLEDMRY
jgi:hypothetical protein